MWLTWSYAPTWIIVVGYKILHLKNDKDQEALGYKILLCTNAIILTEKIKLSVIVSECDGS